MKDGEKEEIVALMELADALHSIKYFMEALEKRVYKLEDVCREILQRLPRFERVETMPLMAGTDRAERVREGQAEGKNVVGASVGLGGSERSNTGGDGNTSSV